MREKDTLQIMVIVRVIANFIPIAIAFLVVIVWSRVDLLATPVAHNRQKL